MATKQFREGLGNSWYASAAYSEPERALVENFKNTYSYPIYIDEIWIAAGVGKNGDYFWSAIGSAYGSGESIQTWITAGSTSTNKVTLSTSIPSIDGSSIGYDGRPPSPTALNKSWMKYTFSTPYKLDSGSTVTLNFHSKGTANTVVCLAGYYPICDNMSGDGTYSDGYPYMVYHGGTYTVVLNPNTGKVEGSTSPVNKTKNGGVALTLPGPTKDSTSLTTEFNTNGHGTKPTDATSTVTWAPTSGNIWNTKSDGTGTKYTTSYNVDAGVTLFAQYTPSYGTISLPSISDAGDYIFNGWYTSSSGGTRAGGAGGTYTPKSGSTLYAQWGRKIHFDGNSSEGTVTDIPNTVSGDVGVDLTIPDTVPKKRYRITYDGNGGTVSPTYMDVYCVFNGWNTRSDGSGDTYAPGQSYIGSETITLYAQWVDPTFGELPLPVRSGKYEGSYIQDSPPEITYSFDKYKFDKWTKTLNGADEITSETIVTSNIIIHAKWQYCVLLMANSDKGQGKFVELMEDAESEPDPDNPDETLSPDKYPAGALQLWKSHGQGISLAHEAYLFQKELTGWSTVKAATSKAYDYSGTYSADVPIQLFAIWEGVKYTVTFKDGFSNPGQDIIKTIKVEALTDVPDSEIPQVGEYYGPPYNKRFDKGIYSKFQGWTGSTISIEADTIISALWDVSYIWICVYNDETGQKEWIGYKPKEGI